MRAIAERFIIRLSAAAKRESFAAGQIVLVPLAVIELDFALDSERAIIFGGNLTAIDYFPFFEALIGLIFLGTRALAIISA